MPRERSSHQTKKSQRQEFREMRRKREQRNRIIVVALIVLGALLFLAALSVQRSIAPTPTSPDIIPITSGIHPNAQGTAMGDPNAPVKIDVWEDFQCPACTSYSFIVETKIAEEYVATGVVYYVFHQYPFIDDLAPTAESDQAANASMCASEQGRFWDYHDILYTNWDGENEGAFTDERLITMAEILGLDMDAFEACFAENTYKAQIEQDLKDGKERGVNGTPSVFVNGKAVTPGYVPSYEDMVAAIEAALAEE